MSRLKLYAMDSEDLQVISACCQDAILHVGELEYYADESRFVLTMNRFAWEAADPSNSEFERRKSVLHFNRVRSVKVQGIDRTQKDTVLSLLSVSFEAADEPEGVIELVFAGDGAIRLEVECIEAQLTDSAAAWGTGSRPAHDADASADKASRPAQDS